MNEKIGMIMRITTCFGDQWPHGWWTCLWIEESGSGFRTRQLSDAAGSKFSRKMHTAHA